MADLASLVVTISANAKNFSSDLQRVQAQSESFSSKVTQSFTRIAKYGIVTATAALAGFGYAITKNQERLNDFAKTANNLNIRPQEALGLEYVAKRVDTSTEDIYRALEFMQQNIEQALQPGQQADVLESLGLDPQSLKALDDPIKQIILIGDAIKQVSSKSQQIFDVKAIFGRGGTDLLGAFKEGFKGILDDANKFRSSLSDADFSNIQKLDDSLDNISTILTGIIDKVTVALTPAFTAFIEEVTKGIQQFGGFDAVANSVAASFLSGLAGVVGFFKGINTAINATKQSILFVEEGLLRIQKFSLQAQNFGNTRKAAEDIYGKAPDLSSQIKEIDDKIAILQDMQDQVGQSTDASNKPSVSTIISNAAASLSSKLSSESQRVSQLPTVPLANSFKPVVGTITVDINASPELLARLQNTDINQSGGLQIITKKSTTDVARQVAR